MFCRDITFRIARFQIVDHLAQSIGGGQDDIHNFRGDNHAPFAQLIQNILGLVRQMVDSVQPQKAGCPLERVHGTKDIVEQGEIIRSLFQFQEVGLNGFEMLFRFRNEVGKKFRITKFLAHTAYLTLTRKRMASRWTHPDFLIGYPSSIFILRTIFSG